MADMTLPFKLLSQPTADTTAQTQKDTRALATNEALQRLKTSGALDVQKQKGRDQLRTTLAPLGIDPTSANYASNLDVLRRGLNALRMGQGVEAFTKGGVRIPTGKAFDPNTGIMPNVLPGYMLPGEAQSSALPKVTTKTADKLERTIDPGGKQVGITGKQTTTQEQKSQVSGSSVKSIATHHIGVVAQALGLDPSAVTGRVVTVNGKPYVEYKDQNGEPRGKKVTPELQRQLPQGAL
jgi:hypothetical protein